MKNLNAKISVRPVNVQVRELIVQARRVAPRRAGGVLVPPRGGSV